MEEELNPISTNRIVKIIAILLTISYLYYFINNWDLTILILKDIKNWDFSVLEYFIPLILFPVGIYGFWLLKKYGWILITILLAYLIVLAFISIVLEIKFWMLYSDIPLFQFLIGSYSLKLSIIQTVIIGSVLTYINLATIRNHFKISNQTSFITISISLLIFASFGLTMLID